jgi:hypothetical protein
MSRVGAAISFLLVGAVSFWMPILLIQIYATDGKQINALWLTLILPLTLLTGFHLIGRASVEHGSRIPASIFTLVGLWTSGPLISFAVIILSGNIGLFTQTDPESAHFLLFLLFFPFSAIFLSAQSGYLPALVLGSVGVVILDRIRLKSDDSDDESNRETP